MASDPALDLSTGNRRFVKDGAARFRFQHSDRNFERSWRGSFSESRLAKIENVEY